MPEGRIVIRCDASPEIGAGHLVRCTSLALALERRGVVAEFAMSAAPPAALDPASRGLAVRLVSRAVEELIALAEERGAGCVLVDHYGVDAASLASLRAAGLTVAVIDDRGDRDLSAAHWLLNQNFAAERIVRGVPGQQVLLGPHYALLRPEFERARATLQRAFDPGDRRVLVTFGAGETAQPCREALRSLDSVPEPLSIRVVLGSGSDADLQSRHDLDVRRNVGDMVEHMTWADVSVNTGGSTCWELLCLGLPIVVTPFDGWPLGNAYSLPEAELAVGVANAGVAGPAVASLLRDPERRSRMSDAGRQLVDGGGADRVAASLASLS